MADYNNPDGILENVQHNLILCGPQLVIRVFCTNEYPIPRFYIFNAVLAGP